MTNDDLSKVKKAGTQEMKCGFCAQRHFGECRIFHMLRMVSGSSEIEEINHIPPWNNTCLYDYEYQRIFLVPTLLCL